MYRQYRGIIINLRSLLLHLFDTNDTNDVVDAMIA